MPPMAGEVGSNRTLSLDIGGTTAKICFIEDGIPQTTRKFEVARAWRDVKGSGLPVRVPTVELVEIGAGGGSIASVDMLRRLKIGPESAGSEPGPAACGRGGAQATVTDAHLIVGNIAADGFADGMITLVPKNAPQAIAQHVMAAMGLDCVSMAAAGIIELADETMANAARVHGIELGHDIAGFDLLVTGGGGALHAARIAEKLGIRRIIVPQNAGVGSAVGFLRSPVAFESAVSVMAVLDEIDGQELSDRIRRQLSDVRAIVGQVVAPERISTAIKIDLRYKGQGLELCLDVEDADQLISGLPALAEAFVTRYTRSVGFALHDIPVEVVCVSVTAREQRQIGQSAAKAPRVSLPDTAQQGTRGVFDLAAGCRIPYAVLERAQLTRAPRAGPAVIREAQTTTLVRPNWSVRSTDLGHLVLERDAP